ncbi:MAG: signal peptide peptidase SppA [Zetaproteobacteria bacterium CG2_30_46_52]|nr:MAG: signal peptide peptidase SppA [Zetaproteobacteria bacterium CG2_30_46_52]
MRVFFSKLMRGIESTRTVVLNLVFLLVLTFILVSLLNARPSLPDKVILQLDLNGVVVEQVNRPDFGLSSLTSPEPNQVLVGDVVAALKRAAKDERVLGVRLDLQELSQASLPHLEEIRTAINTFKASGKPVMAYAEHWTQPQYYLAASANQVFLHPMGHIALHGFGVYRNYIADALAKLDVDVHVFRAGKYKSAAAPLIQNEMSAAEKEADAGWLNTMWDVYKQGLFEMRGLDAARLQEVLDHPAKYMREYGADLGKLFVAEHWIDGLMYAEQADAHLLQTAGEGELVAYKDYLRASGQSFMPAGPGSADNWVGVIMGSGQILGGEQPSGTIGSDTMLEQLRIALDDERVKAVVLRLNTPGGSALASETIRHAVEVLRQAGKPVVVSMGNMAASGGYWIASSANEIWASPATLTGSIGVFGIVPNVNRSLKKLGVNTDGVGTTKIAGSMRLDMPLSKEMGDAVQMSVNQIYQQFIQHVADGRNLPIETVQALAQGRVWSGRDALANGLVDKLGGVHDAIDAAAALANLKDFEPVQIDPPKNALDVLVDNLLSETSAMFGVSANEHSIFAGLLQTLQNQMAMSAQMLQMNDPRGVYALSEMGLAE